MNKPLRRLAPGKNPPIQDIIVTPDVLAREIVDHFAPRGKLLDPARGSGAFYRAMQRHSSKVDWCEIAAGVDFFQYHKKADWIITNPPWSKMRDYILHAMTLAPDIVFLMTVPHVATKARLRDMDAAGYGVEQFLRVAQPPPPWPSSGFQLGAVHIRKGAVGLFPWIPTKVLRKVA